MNFKNYLLASSILLALPTLGCAQSPPLVAEGGRIKPQSAEETEGRKVTNAVAIQNEAHNFVDIEFVPGSAKLTDKAKNSLHTIIRQARSAGTIDQAIVLSWSDEDFPSKNLTELPQLQRDLAEKRNESVEHYMRTIKKIDVDAYNMAEHPNTVSKWFNTSDNKLKNSFLQAGLPTTADSPQYSSKASHSVVLIKLE